MYGLVATSRFRCYTCSGKILTGGTYFNIFSPSDPISVCPDCEEKYSLSMW